MLRGAENLFVFTRVTPNTCERAEGISCTQKIGDGGRERRNRSLKGAVLFAMAGLVLAGHGMARAESTGRVYHGVGPVMFTNSSAWGHADGQPAGTNFLCGLYAGVDTNALAPCFGPPGSYLKRLLSPAGGAFMWGTVVVDAPPDMPLWLQFRVWPAEYGTYEEAAGASVLSPPVGVSEIVPAIPPNVIIELPLQAGPVWLAPVMRATDPSVRLTCVLAPGSVTLCWPTNAAGFLPTAASSLASNTLWNPVGGALVASNGQNRASVPATNAFQFFRLRR